MIDLEPRPSRRRLLTLSLTAVLAFSLQSCAHAPRHMSATATMYETEMASMAMAAPHSATAAPEFDMSAPPPPPPPPPVESAEPHFTDPQPVHAAATHRPSAAAAGPTFAEAAAPAEGPPAEDRLYCEVARRFASTEECRYYTTLKAQAKTGLGAVKFPASITRGETRQVSFVISAAAAGEGSTPTELMGSVPSEEFKLKVTGRMGATLHGEGFKIVPDKMVYHDIGISDAARWDWDITALKAPHHKLTLTAYMIVEKPDGSQSEEALPSVERDIPVKVTWAQSFSDLVESMVSISDQAKILIGAFTALLVALLTFKAKVAELVGPFFGRKTPHSKAEDPIPRRGE